MGLFCSPSFHLQNAFLLFLKANLSHSCSEKIWTESVEYHGYVIILLEVSTTAKQTAKSYSGQNKRNIYQNPNNAKCCCYSCFF